MTRDHRQPWSGPRRPKRVPGDFKVSWAMKRLLIILFDHVIVLSSFDSWSFPEIISMVASIDSIQQSHSA